MGGENSGHELVFMMHLLKHFNGPTALFRFLHDSKLGDLSFLVASYMDKLAVSCALYIHVLLCMIVCLFVCVTCVLVDCM